jgi:hypothetical protein
MFNRPVQFNEALQLQAVKTALPTTLDSAQLRALGGELHRRALVSSQVARAEIFDGFAAGINRVLSGETDPAQFRVDVRATLETLNYRPEAEQINTIKDLRTEQRLKVLLDTNTRTARGFAQARISNDPDVIEEYPAWELLRAEERRVPRGASRKPNDIGWEERWQFAARSSGDNDAYRILDQTGRMVALKSSPLWAVLGSAWDDSLGNPYPPFAYASGMGVEEVDIDDAISLGLVARGAEIAPAEIGLNDGFKVLPKVQNEALLDGLLNSLRDLVTIKNGVLTLS